jgi:hypothetical protein
MTYFTSCVFNLIHQCIQKSWFACNESNIVTHLGKETVIFGLALMSYNSWVSINTNSTRKVYHNLYHECTRCLVDIVKKKLPKPFPIIIIIINHTMNKCKWAKQQLMVWGCHVNIATKGKSLHVCYIVSGEFKKQFHLWRWRNLLQAREYSKFLATLFNSSRIRYQTMYVSLFYIYYIYV